MDTIKIHLTCPRCGNSNWIVRDDDEAEGAFECASCGDLVFTEDMVAVTDISDIAEPAIVPIPADTDVNDIHRYTNIVKCTLVSRHNKYDNCYLLSTGANYDLDIEITSCWMFNDDDIFEIQNPEIVATVNTLDELIQFIKDNGFDEPEWTYDNRCLRVGGERDKILFPDLTAIWASDTEKYQKYAV